MLINIDFTDKYRTKPAQPRQLYRIFSPPNFYRNEERLIYPGDEGGFCLRLFEFINIS
jgi:hypothetical protein